MTGTHAAANSPVVSDWYEFLEFLEQEMACWRMYGLLVYID